MHVGDTLLTGIGFPALRHGDRQSDSIKMTCGWNRFPENTGFYSVLDACCHFLDFAWRGEYSSGQCT